MRMDFRRLRNIAAAFALPVLLSALLSGCSFRMQPIDELMRPPLPFGENEQLQKDFRTAVGEDLILKTPLSGQFHSSFIAYDLDGDGDEEVLVFYATKAEKEVLRFCVMKKQEGKWLRVNDTSGSGSELYSVSFVDILGDGTPEILIIWNMRDTKTSKLLTVYSYVDQELPSNNSNQGVLRQITSEKITMLLPVDMDGDGALELFFVYQESAAQLPQSYARVLKMDAAARSFSLLAETRLDADVSGYLRITAQEEAGMPARVFVDAMKGDSQMITEFLYLDAKSGQLHTPLLDMQKLTNTATLRPALFTSMDIDKDGRIEIPAHEVWPGSKTVREGNLSQDLLYYSTKWQVVDNRGEITDEFICAMMAQDQYYFRLPENWQWDTFSIVCDEMLREMRVFNYDTENEKTGELLFSLFAVSNMNAANYDSFITLYRTENASVFAAITEAGEKQGINTAFLKRYVQLYEGVK